MKTVLIVKHNMEQPNDIHGAICKNEKVSNKKIMVNYISFFY